jgi:uncharacterized membrane protein YuzA (DUF378 family)
LRAPDDRDLLLATGLELGVAGLTGFNAIRWLFGSFSWLGHILNGACSLWLMLRQVPNMTPPA